MTKTFSSIVKKLIYGGKMENKTLTENQKLYYTVVENVKKLSRDVLAVAKVDIDEIDLAKTDKASCRVYFTGVGMLNDYKSIDYLADAIKNAHNVWFGTYDDPKGGKSACVTLWVRRLRDTGAFLEADELETLDDFYNTPGIDEFLDSLD